MAKCKKKIVGTLRVEDNWLCREHILKQFDYLYFEFADYLLAKNIDYENDTEEILQALDTFFCIEDWTEEEINHMHTQAIFACAYREMMKEGILEEVAPGQLRCIQKKKKNARKTKKS